MLIQLASVLNLKLETPIPALSDTWFVVLRKLHVTGLQSRLPIPSHICYSPFIFHIFHPSF